MNKNIKSGSTAVALFSASQIAALIATGELAVSLVRAEHAAKMAKHNYYSRIHCFEESHGRADSRIDPRKPEHAKVIKFTKVSFEAYQEAKRKVYNIRRRLNNAARKAGALIGAVS